MQTSRHNADTVSKLIFELSKLPGIGEKTATRLAYFILKQSNAYAQSLAESILNAKQKTILCHICFTFTDSDPCRICSNPERDRSIICVVERPTDVMSIEQTGTYKGLYHVLHGVLSPLDGIGPEELKIRELLMRLSGHYSQNKLAPIEPSLKTGDRPSTSVRELILATNSSVEGEATALYLTKLIRPLEIKLTKLAHGLPVGSLLEYTDKQTIGKALENRMEMS